MSKGQVSLPDAPIIKVDREALNAFELKVAEVALYQMADFIDMLTKTGGAYTQLVLPPAQAAAKRAAMNGRGA